MTDILKPELLLPLAVPVTFFAMTLLEETGRGPVWLEDPSWRLKGWAYLGMIGGVNALVFKLAPQAWRAAPLVEGARFGPMAGGLMAFILFSAGNATLHYSYHRFDLLWELVHRRHHEPERFGVAGVMVQTPFEALNNALLFALVSAALGLEPAGAALGGYLAAFYGMFQHLNFPTPRALGRLIQRPESHTLHHRRGRHNWNYSDLPLWDMLAGTYRNPRRFSAGPLGFGRSPAVHARIRP